MKQMRQKNHERQKRQVSDSIPLAILLTLSGGFMDAYSYLCRGEVFANAQTGNILLFGVNMSTGSFTEAVKYLLPVLAFALGIAQASVLRHKFQNRPRIHWRQIVVITEGLLFLMIAFIPRRYDLLANSLISMACGAQVESFRTFHGNGLATTMCIGNLRQAVRSSCDYWFTKNREAGKRGLLSFGVIVTFAAGAILGNFFVVWWQERAIWVSTVFMIAAFVLMLTQYEDNE